MIPSKSLNNTGLGQCDSVDFPFFAKNVLAYPNYLCMFNGREHLNVAVCCNLHSVYLPDHLLTHRRGRFVGTLPRSLGRCSPSSMLPDSPPWLLMMSPLVSLLVLLWRWQCVPPPVQVQALRSSPHQPSPGWSVLNSVWCRQC